MKRALLHLDTDPMDARSLRWAHEAGLEVISTGRDDQNLDHLHVDEYQVLSSDDLAGLMSLAEAHVDQSTEQAPSRGLAGVFSSKKEPLSAMAQLAEAFQLQMPSPQAVERALDPRAQTAHLSDLGIRCLDREQLTASARRFGASAFFRDGDFVRGGIVEHCDLEQGHARFGFQGHLEPALEDELYAALENAARGLELDAGPVGASLAHDAEGVALLDLVPCFEDTLMSSYLAPIALGKSPIQAWFAALAEAGGPFDSMPHRPIGVAGWMALRASSEGTLAEVQGLDRARACAGIEGVRIMLPRESSFASQSLLAVLWARGDSVEELRARLENAAGRLSLEFGESTAA